MGFELKVQKGSLGDEAEIRSVDSKDFAASFIEVVKQCVGKRVLDITINVSGFEASFPQIRESALKLAQFVATKGFKLRVMGPLLSNQEIEQLQSNGIAYLRAPKLVAPGLKSAIKQFEETKKLPTEPLLANDAEIQRDEYNVLRERLEKLEAELKSFRTHKEIMMKNKISLESAKKELGKIQATSEKSKLALEEIARCKIELVKLSAQVDEEERRLVDFTKKSDQENRRKAEAIKRELDGEKNKFNRRSQEFTKKSEQRLAEIEKLKAAANPNPEKK